MLSPDGGSGLHDNKLLAHQRYAWTSRGCWGTRLESGPGCLRDSQATGDDERAGIECGDGGFDPPAPTDADRPA